MVIGFGMTLPKVLPWINSHTGNGKQYYAPKAHTDIIYSLGTWSISKPKLMTRVAIIGSALALTALAGIVLE